MSLCTWTARSEGAAPSAPSLLQRSPPDGNCLTLWSGSFLRISLEPAAVRPSFLVFVARDGTCLPADHGLLSSQRHWPHARVGIGNALVGGGLRHHHRRRRVKRLSVQSCKCARKASGCSRSPCARTCSSAHSAASLCGDGDDDGGHLRRERCRSRLVHGASAAETRVDHGLRAGRCRPELQRRGNSDGQLPAREKF